MLHNHIILLLLVVLQLKRSKSYIEIEISKPDGEKLTFKKGGWLAYIGAIKAKLKQVSAREDASMINIMINVVTYALEYTQWICLVKL